MLGKPEEDFLLPLTENSHLYNQRLDLCEPLRVCMSEATRSLFHERYPPAEICEHAHHSNCMDADGEIFGDITESETDERELILEHSIDELGLLVSDDQKAIFLEFEPQLALIRRARYLQNALARLAEVINQKTARY